MITDASTRCTLNAITKFLHGAGVGEQVHLPSRSEKIVDSAAWLAVSVVVRLVATHGGQATTPFLSAVLVRAIEQSVTFCANGRVCHSNICSDVIQKVLERHIGV